MLQLGGKKASHFSKFVSHNVWMRTYFTGSNASIEMTKKHVPADIFKRLDESPHEYRLVSEKSANYVHARYEPNSGNRGGGTIFQPSPSLELNFYGRNKVIHEAYHGFSHDLMGMRKGSIYSVASVTQDPEALVAEEFFANYGHMFNQLAPGDDPKVAAENAMQVIKNNYKKEFGWDNGEIKRGLEIFLGIERGDIYKNHKDYLESKGALSAIEGEIKSNLS